MRRIAHISDLHFGTVDVAVAERLVADIDRLDPHLILVSGDLTQRARRQQFRDARVFLDRLAAPKIIVPGNHDIPLYNVAARFGWPLANYIRYVTDDLTPTYDDEELAVAGVNTARSNTWKDGRVSLEQIDQLRAYFHTRPPEAFRILAAHHPFIPSPNEPGHALVGRAPEALQMLETCGCALVATGHLHYSHVADARTHHVELRRAILVAQAGTATSRRRRDQPNAYNALTVDGACLTLEVRTDTGTAFKPTNVGAYERSDAGWIPRRPPDAGQAEALATGEVRQVR